MQTKAPFKHLLTVVHEEKNGDLSLVPIKPPVQKHDDIFNYIKYSLILKNAMSTAPRKVLGGK